MVFSLLAEGVESGFGGLEEVLLACGTRGFREVQLTMAKRHYTAEAVVESED